MTSKKQLKARIRARMAKTGESYTTARLHVAGRPEPVSDGGWHFTGGRHPSSAAIAAVLANQGVAVSEPMVFLRAGASAPGTSCGSSSTTVPVMWSWPSATRGSTTAAREGLRDCATHLSAASDSFSLPAWRKWARLRPLSPRGRGRSRRRARR